MFVDVDECAATGLNGCDDAAGENGFCINNHGSYTCGCNTGNLFIIYFVYL